MEYLTAEAIASLMDDLLRWAEEGSITLEEFKQIWKQIQEDRRCET